MWIYLVALDHYNGLADAYLDSLGTLALPWVWVIHSDTSAKELMRHLRLIVEDEALVLIAELGEDRATLNLEPSVMRMWD